MEKAKLCAYVLLAVLCVAVPLALLLVFYHTPAMPQDLSRYDYLALTTPVGEEHIFAQGETTFAVTAETFEGATAVSALPSTFSRELFLTAAWIRDGRQRTYRLYLSPIGLAGYAVDEQGNAYHLQQEGCLFLLQQGFSSALLIGEDPPALTVAGKVIPFSLCQWTYQVPGAAPLSSGEYQNTEGGTYPIAEEVFAPHFSVAPNSFIYTVYSGADEVFSSDSLPDWAALPTGDYQLVLVAEWQSEAVCIRAGYSFLFSR